MPEAPSICVVGLGYVGLPLAIALGRHFRVVGFDTNRTRVAELRRGVDRTGEIDEHSLREPQVAFVDDAPEIRGCDLYIITVPTPVDVGNQPDLGAVRAACRTVGGVISRGAVVVLESTVYPGVTEEICGPEIEAVSGLTCGQDFFLGYSPERINPGDKKHTVDRITKVVAGQTEAVAQKLAATYGAITTGGVFVARSIKVAEAAKVIENAQRDINIAFINEVTMIFNRLGLSVYDVLEASATKWNFLPFTPGLVGGHCIGVDPFYLADLANRLGHDPAVILAGRRINDAMSTYVADGIVKAMGKRQPRVLVLGLTFKENVPDLRNSKVVDMVRQFTRHGCTVDVHDPHADAEEARREYDVALMTGLDGARGYDCVVGAVAHSIYCEFDGERLARLLVAGGLIADVKGMWRKLALPATVTRWQL